MVKRALKRALGQDAAEAKKFDKTPGAYLL
jgi:hypothetical protein